MIIFEYHFFYFVFFLLEFCLALGIVKFLFSSRVFIFNRGCLRYMIIAFQFFLTCSFTFIERLLVTCLIYFLPVYQSLYLSI